MARCGTLIVAALPIPGGLVIPRGRVRAALVSVVVAARVTLRAAITAGPALAGLGSVAAVLLVRLLLIWLLVRLLIWLLPVRAAVLGVLRAVALLALAGVASVRPVAKAAAVDSLVVLVAAVTS
jgi:CHASE2 domain-containing sensor protein